LKFGTPCYEACNLISNLNRKTKWLKAQIGPCDTRSLKTNFYDFQIEKISLEK
jgi:hypothetical protein